MNKIATWLNKLSAIVRLILCLGAALLLFAAVLISGMEILTAVMLAWDAFCIFMIVLSWITFFTVPHSKLRREVPEQDESHTMIFIIVLATVCISLVGTLLLMRTTNESLVSRDLHRTVSLSGVALSWILMHTVFTLHYAHLYYANTAKNTAPEKRGLEFPEEDSPDYLDFAYFSFVVGMTFQVSDVQVTTKQLRKLVLLHGLISFVFNTLIVALTISVVSNLLH